MKTETATNCTGITPSLEAWASSRCLSVSLSGSQPLLPFWSCVPKPWWLSSTQEALPTLLMENKGLIPSTLEPKMDMHNKWKCLLCYQREHSPGNRQAETQDLSNSTTQTVNTGEAAGKATVTWWCVPHHREEVCQGKMSIQSFPHHTRHNSTFCQRRFGEPFLAVCIWAPP